MAEAFIRNGRLTGSPLAGADLDRLTHQQKRDVLGVLRKAEDGKAMTLDDMTTIMKARKAALPVDAVAKAQQTLAQLKEALR